MIKKISGVILVLFSLHLHAQKNDSSPYSSFGIGNEVQAKTVREMSMGGIGTAPLTSYLSFSNPASYASLDLTSYTLSGENRAYNLTDDNGSATTSNLYLNYVAMGIPMGRNGGLAFGLQQNSTVGYSIYDRTYDADGNQTAVYYYEGDGGTSRVFLGFAYEMFKSLSLGVEGKYIFGKATNTSTSQVDGIALNTQHKSGASGNGFGLKVGLIYNQKLANGLNAKLGASFEQENSLDVKGEQYVYSTDGFFPRDTILDEQTNSSFVTPLKTNLGISIESPNRWGMGVDYSFRDAIQVETNSIVSNSKLTYDKYQRIGVGGFFIPRYNSLSNYYKRISYRLGTYYQQNGMLFSSAGSSDYTNPDEYGITFGLGLPLGKRKSKLDASFEYGERGTTDHGLTKEKYFIVRFAFQFSDKWFVKREIN